MDEKSDGYKLCRMVEEAIDELNLNEIIKVAEFLGNLGIVNYHDWQSDELLEQVLVVKN